MAAAVPVPVGFPKAVAQAVDDLAAIAARLPAMHDEGWHPARTASDRPSPPRPPDAPPDFVPGATWDCGLGDHQVRERWTVLVGHLHRAEQQATDVLCAAFGMTSRCVPVCRPTSLLDAQSSTRRLQERVGALSAFLGQADSRQARWLETHLAACLGDIAAAYYQTVRVVPIVGTGKAPATCIQCRRLGTIGQPRRGGLCYTCYTRNQRAGLPRRTTVVVKQRRATLRAKRR